jgi:hypothetical protein
MTPDDLRSELLRLNTVEESASARAFVERLPNAAALQFFRPFRDDVVLAASVRNGPEHVAFEIGVQVLDTLEQRWGELRDREVTKLAPWNAGPAFADALLVPWPRHREGRPHKGLCLPLAHRGGLPHQSHRVHRRGDGGRRRLCGGGRCTSTTLHECPLRSSSVATNSKMATVQQGTLRSHLLVQSSQY